MKHSSRLANNSFDTSPVADFFTVRVWVGLETKVAARGVDHSQLNKLEVFFVFGKSHPRYKQD